jgi:hypothetical protein
MRSAPSRGPRSFDSLARDYDRLAGFAGPGLRWLAEVGGLEGRRPG